MCTHHVVTCTLIAREEHDCKQAKDQLFWRAASQVNTCLRVLNICSLQAKVVRSTYLESAVSVAGRRRRRRESSYSSHMSPGVTFVAKGRVPLSFLLSSSHADAKFGPEKTLFPASRTVDDWYRSQKQRYHGTIWAKLEKNRFGGNTFLHLAFLSFIARMKCLSSSREQGSKAPSG